MDRSLSSTLKVLSFFLVVGVVGMCWHEEREDRKNHELYHSYIDEGERIGELSDVVAASPKPKPSEQVETPSQRTSVSPLHEPLHGSTQEPGANAELQAELVQARAEVAALHAQISDLQVELSIKAGPVRRWLAWVNPQQQPDLATVKQMALLLHAFPVELRYEEGMWLVERINKQDWKSWGPTIDDAIFTYLGETRLQNELTPEQFEACKP